MPHSLPGNVRVYFAIKSRSPLMIIFLVNVDLVLSPTPHSYSGRLFSVQRYLLTWAYPFHSLCRWLGFSLRGRNAAETAGKIAIVSGRVLAKASPFTTKGKGSLLVNCSIAWNGEKPRKRTQSAITSPPCPMDDSHALLADAHLPESFPPSVLRSHAWAFS